MSHRSLKWSMSALAAILMIIAAVLVFFDWNWLRHPIEHLVTEKTGRTLTIKGNIHVKLGWPLAQIQVSDVTFANPAWASQPLMFTLKRLDGSISLSQLLERHIWLPTVRLEQPQVFLEKNPDGRKNWLLDRHQQDENSQAKIGNLLLDNGQISYLDPLHHTQIQAHLYTRHGQSDNAPASIVFAATGQWMNLPLIASGSGGSVLALDDEATPYPLDIDVSVARTHLHATGTVTSLPRISAVNLSFNLNGPSLDQLYPLIGIALPSTPAYVTHGHLLHHAQQWRYEKFIVHIGKSEATGNLQVDHGKQRPFLQGDFNFQQLNLADLGALIGTKKSGSSAHGFSGSEQPATPIQSGTKLNQHGVLPKIPFRIQRWNSVDADVTVQAENIQRARALPITKLLTRIQMHDSILSLNPLNFGVAGGTLAGKITLNGQNDPIHAQAQVHVRKVFLNQLFPTIKLTHSSVGQINGDFDLSAEGNAINQMLASANGKVVLVIDSGEISKLMLETIALHLWEIFELELTGDKLVKLNCAVADFDVNNGVLQTQTMILDTRITTITGSGDINMAQETLHLDLQPHTKIISPLALRSPIYIRGTFSNPKITLDKTKLVVRSAGALALGAINPFLAILPLIDAGPGENSQCGKLIEQAWRPDNPATRNPSRITPTTRH
ncbi:MAG: AsmA family protein [Betaproteobacteria bacterium]|nr:AsmA family protein [Betaproteobacteria bacterium]